MQIDEYKQMLKYLDWYYFMSDDGTAYRKGEQAVLQAQRIAETSTEHMQAYQEAREKLK